MGSLQLMSTMSGIERVSVDLTPVKNCLKPVVWVVGGPGSGRSTQCEYLQAKHGWVHISSGFLLRQEVLSGSKRGTQLFTVMQRGDLVPHEVVLDILAQKMVETVPGANGFLIDGFPLDMEEALTFEKQVVPVTRIIHLKLDPREMRGRLDQRENFDDKPQAVNKRIETFQGKTIPVLEKYKYKTVEVDAKLPKYELTEIVLEALTGPLKHGGWSIL